MRLSRTIGLIGIFTLFFFGFSNPLISYKINSDQAKVGFDIRNLGLNVDGTFSGLTGTVQFDAEDLAASKIEAKIPVKSINTDIKKRDEHLRGEDFFDVAKYPNISFSSTSITSSDGGYKVVGNFTIKKTTKSVSIPFTFSNSTFVGKFEIDRRDYGVGGNSWTMGDKVKISFEIPVVAM